MSGLHIVAIPNFRDWAVQLGAYNLKDEGDEEWIEKRIKETKIHPKFELNSKAAYFDVAILVLDSPVVFCDSIRPVCLPNAPSDDADHLIGAAVSVSGWGKTDELSPSVSETLKTAHITVYKQR